MAWKYIMFKDSTGRLFPVIFPDVMVHQEVSHGIRRAFRHLRAAAIDSAGSIDGVEVRNVHGNSETLQVRSSPERDTSVIRNYGYAHGVGYEVTVTTTMSDAARRMANPEHAGTLRPDQPAQRLSRNDRRFLRLTNQPRGTGHGSDFGRE